VSVGHCFLFLFLICQFSHWFDEPNGVLFGKLNRLKIINNSSFQAMSVSNDSLSPNVSLVSFNVNKLQQPDNNMAKAQSTNQLLNDLLTSNNFTLQSLNSSILAMPTSTSNQTHFNSRSTNSIMFTQTPATNSAITSTIPIQHQHGYTRLTAQQPVRPTSSTATTALSQPISNIQHFSILQPIPVHPTHQPQQQYSTNLLTTQATAHTKRKVIRSKAPVEITRIINTDDIQQQQQHQQLQQAQIQTPNKRQKKLN
jgi:hypothetical protein